MFQNRPIGLVTASALALCVGACGDEVSSPSEDGPTVADYVSSVSIDDTSGTLRTGRIPRPTADGPSLSIQGNPTIVNGGTTTLNVTSPTPFETVHVAGSAPISGLFTLVSGFFEIPLPSPATSADLLIAFPQDLPADEFRLYVSAADAAGNVGTVREMPFDALFVGTGDVQVTVAWDADSDVDLHVVDPDGWEIFWGSRQSPSGGQLDLDSNAACAIDGVRNENITWGVGMAPEGTYTVRVDYWSGCDVSQTNYTVLINNGGEIEIHHGTFQGSGDNGGYGSGVLIGTFTRTSGPPPSALRSGRTQMIPAGPISK